MPLELSAPPLLPLWVPTMANGGVSMRDNQSFFKLLFALFSCLPLWLPLLFYSSLFLSLSFWLWLLSDSLPTPPLPIHNRLVKQTPKVLQLYYVVFSLAPSLSSSPSHSASPSLLLCLCLRILNRAVHCRQHWRRSVSR